MRDDGWRAGLVARGGLLGWLVKAAELAGICAALWFTFGWFQIIVPMGLARLDGMSVDAFRIYDPLWDFGANNIAVGLTLVVLWLALRVVERRSVADFVSPERRFRVGLFAKGFVAWVVAMTIVRVLLSAAGLRAPLLAHLVPGFGTLAMVALTFLIQAPAEELIFRGYLTARLAALIPLRGPIPAVIGIIGSSAAFALIHFYHAAGTVQIFILGLGCSLVRVIDGRLERAMGLHTALNVMIAVIFGLNGPRHYWPSLMRLPPAPRADWIDVIGLIATFALMLAFSYAPHLLRRRR